MISAIQKGFIQNLCKNEKLIEKCWTKRLQMEGDTNKIWRHKPKSTWNESIRLSLLENEIDCHKSKATS